MIITIIVYLIINDTAYPQFNGLEGGNLVDTNGESITTAWAI